MIIAVVKYRNIRLEMYLWIDLKLYNTTLKANQFGLF